MCQIGEILAGIRVLNVRKDTTEKISTRRRFKARAVQCMPQPGVAGQIDYCVVDSGKY